MQYITIKESHYESDLTILKSRLEAEGIKCRFKDEFTTQVFSHLSSMTVELQVANDDLSKAVEIMKEAGEKVPEKEVVHCPKCDSTAIKVKYDLGNSFKIAFLLLKTLFTFKSIGQVLKSSSLKCKMCGLEFRHI